jgi:hypothetical protein
LSVWLTKQFPDQPCDDTIPSLCQSDLVVKGLILSKIILNSRG